MVQADPALQELLSFAHACIPGRCTEAEAREALVQCGQNVEAALERLLRQHDERAGEQEAQRLEALEGGSGATSSAVDEDARYAEELQEKERLQERKEKEDEQMARDLSQRLGAVTKAPKMGLLCDGCGLAGRQGAADS